MSERVFLGPSRAGGIALAVLLAFGVNGFLMYGARFFWERREYTSVAAACFFLLTIGLPLMRMGLKALGALVAGPQAVIVDSVGVSLGTIRKGVAVTTALVPWSTIERVEIAAGDALTLYGATGESLLTVNGFPEQTELASHCQQLHARSRPQEPTGA